MQDLFGKVEAALSATLCAVLSCIFVLMIYPNSSTNWDVWTIIDWTAALFSPLALIIWSVVARSRYRMQTLRWTQLLIRLHAILAIPFVFFAFMWFVLAAYMYARLVSIAVSVDLLLLGLGPSVSAGADLLRIYRNGLMALSAAGLAILFIWSFATVGLVVWRAEAAAGGRPYCIQVPKDAEGHYQPVTSIPDLTGLRLRAPVLWSVAGSPGGRFNFHAVLAIENGGDEGLSQDGEAFEQERWNWSHRAAQFIPIQGHDVHRVCAVARHFARELPIVPARKISHE
jgi:hypothetical protein